MPVRFWRSLAIAVAFIALLLALGPASVGHAQTAQPRTAAAAQAIKTPWGEPDLQGIWTYEFDTPLQRLTKYATQEFFTEEQRAELDRERTAMLVRDGRQERGSEMDVNRGYNSVFLSVKRISARTSLIVDPPNGRIPSLTPEAQKLAAADRDFRLALLQSTDTCRNKAAACGGGTYDP